MRNFRWTFFGNLPANIFSVDQIVGRFFQKLSDSAQISQFNWLKVWPHFETEIEEIGKGGKFNEESLKLTSERLDQVLERLDLLEMNERTRSHY